MQQEKLLMFQPVENDTLERACMTKEQTVGSELCQKRKFVFQKNLLLQVHSQILLLKLQIRSECS